MDKDDQKIATLRHLNTIAEQSKLQTDHLKNIRQNVFFMALVVMMSLLAALLLALFGK